MSLTINTNAAAVTASYNLSRNNAAYKRAFHDSQVVKELFKLQMTPGD